MSIMVVLKISKVKLIEILCGVWWLVLIVSFDILGNYLKEIF